MRSVRRPSSNVRLAAKQRGVVLVITLIALAVLLLGSVALMRSVSTSAFLSGNLAFKRDLVNHGERGMAAALATLRTGALSSDITRESSLPGSNYSATTLAADVQGIPLLLSTESAYGSSGFSAADISDSAAGVTVRYAIDRQCEAGTSSASATACIVTVTKSDRGGTDYLSTKKPGGDVRPVYRISVRVNGPRGTQSFFQTTVTL
jgi:type IV pilus assembly protein PilX